MHVSRLSVAFVLAVVACAHAPRTSPSPASPLVGDFAYEGKVDGAGTVRGRISFDSAGVPTLIADHRTGTCSAPKNSGAEILIACESFTLMLDRNGNDLSTSGRVTVVVEELRKEASISSDCSSALNRAAPPLCMPRREAELVRHTYTGRVAVRRLEG